MEMKRSNRREKPVLTPNTKLQVLREDEGALLIAGEGDCQKIAVEDEREYQTVKLGVYL